MLMTHIIREPCVGIKGSACADVCPVDCMYGKYEDFGMSYIHSEECIDCDLCVDICPVEGISQLDEVPDKCRNFIHKNYEHFRLEAH